MDHESSKCSICNFASQSFGQNKLIMEKFGWSSIVSDHQRILELEERIKVLESDLESRFRAARIR